MTEAEYFGEGSTVNIGRKKEIFKKGQKFKVTYSLLDYVFIALNCIEMLFYVTIYTDCLRNDAIKHQMYCK